MLQPMMEDLFLARPDNPAEVRARPGPAPALRRSARAPRLTRRPPPACAQYIVQYLSGASTDGAKRMDALATEIETLKAHIFQI